MPKTANLSIQYWYTGEYREEYGPDGNASIVGINTTWGDYFAFPGAMLGTNKSVNEGTGISRTLPEKHRSRPWMFCSGLRLLNTSGAPAEGPEGDVDFADPVDANIGTEYAHWEATFTGPKYVLKPDSDDDDGQTELYRYVQVMPEYSVEFLEQPGNTWKWTEPPLGVLNQNVTIPFQSIHYILRWWWVPYASINFELFGQYQNSANSELFSVQKIAAQPGQLLFDGFSFGDLVYDAGGTPCQHIDMSFLYRKSGWNSFFRNGRAGNSPGFVGVISAQGDPPRAPFLLNDLTELFTS